MTPERRIELRELSQILLAHAAESPPLARACLGALIEALDEIDQLHDDMAGPLIFGDSPKETAQ